jgi:hypothetical protein
VSQTSKRVYEAHTRQPWIHLVLTGDSGEAIAARVDGVYDHNKRSTPNSERFARQVSSIMLEAHDQETHFADYKPCYNGHGPVARRTQV